MLLRQAEIQDIDGIMNVEHQSFINSIQETKDVFAGRIQMCRDCFIVFEDDSHKICGYFSAEKWAAVPSSDDVFKLNHRAENFHCTEGSVLYLSSFALLPEYRGHGNGRELFSQAVSWFVSHNKNIRQAILLVNETWKGALHIYTQYGFRETHRIPSFFAGENGLPSDGIVMVKDL